MPEAKATCPSISQPRSSRVAVPTGAATELARKSWPAKICSCACAGHHDETIRAWFIVRPRHQPVETQPRAISCTTRMYVGTSNS